MNKLNLFKATIGLGLALAQPLVAAASETVVLRFSNWQPPAHFITTDMLTPWTQEVEQATNGRVKVELINPLGKPQAHLDLVRNGIADIGMSVHSYTASRFPLTEFAELPFTTEDSGVNSQAYWDTYQKFMTGADEHRGVKLLGAWTSPPSVILTTKENVNSLKDLEGSKLRSPSPLFDEVSKQLGATPVTAPASEAYEMLSRGVIDGMYFQYDQIHNFKLDRLIKSVVAVPGGFGKTSLFLFMNERKWNQLSPEDQAAILSVSEKHMAKTFGEKWHQSEQNAIQSLTADGLHTYIVEGDELQELKEKLAPLEQKWIQKAASKNVDGQAVLDYYREQIQTFSQNKTN